jgi:hypothetical protein
MSDESLSEKQNKNVSNKNSTSAAAAAANTTPCSNSTLKYYTDLFSKSNIIKLLLRVAILFSLGSGLGFVLNVLQMEYKTNLFPNNVLLFLQNNWFFLPLCGLAASKFEFSIN